MKQLIWLALLLPIFAQAQNTNGTLQRQIASPNIIRGLFGSTADTIPSVRGVAVQGQLLQYNSTYKKWVPYTIPIDGATGIISGGTITGLGGASAIVASGTGTVLDITNPVSPSLSEVAWATDTIALTDNSINYLYVTSGGVVTATAVQATPSDYRTRIYLGRLQKTSGAITSINGDYVPIQQTPANLNDMFKAYGMAKSGLAVTPASTDLTIAVSSGSIFSLGANFSNSVLAPNTLNYTANSPQTFRMVTSGGISVTDITVLPVGSYNPTGTTVSAIGGGANESSIFTVYKFPTTGNVRVLYGQTLYPSLTAAVSAIGSYSPSPPASFSDGIIIGYIAAVKTATDLSNTAQAVFVTTNKFGLAGGAVASSALANYMQTDFSNATGTLGKANIDTTATGVQTVSNFFPKGDTRYVKKTGDTMTGKLVIDADVSGNSAFRANGIKTVLNAHAYDDWSFLEPTGTQADGYSSFDAKAQYTSSAKMDHFVGYQARNIYNGSDSLQNYMYGFRSFPAHGGTGLMVKNVGVQIDDIAGTGPVESNYGIYIENIARGSFTNYSIFTNGGAHRFGGDTYITGSLGINTSDLSNRLGVNGNSLFSGTHTQDGSLLTQFSGSTKGGIYGDATRYVFQTIPTVNLAWEPGGVEKMRLFETGNLHIGYTTEQSYRLAVNGTGNFNGRVSSAGITSTSDLTWGNGTFTSSGSKIYNDATFGNGTVLVPTTGTINDLVVVSAAGSPLLSNPTGTSYLTTVTQSAGDNSTKIATTAYVDNATGSRQLEEWYTDAGNVGSGATTLYSYTLPANTLSANGAKLSFTISGTYALNSNDKTLSFTFGNNGFGFGTVTTSGGSWIIEGTIVRTSTTDYRITLSKADTGGTTSIQSSSGTVGNYTGTNPFLISATGVATNDIIAKMGILEYKPVAP